MFTSPGGNQINSLHVYSALWQMLRALMQPVYRLDNMKSVTCGHVCWVMYASRATAGPAISTQQTTARTMFDAYMLKRPTSPSQNSLAPSPISTVSPCFPVVPATSCYSRE